MEAIKQVVKIGQKIGEMCMASMRLWRELRSLNTMNDGLATTLTIYRAGVASWEAMLATKEAFHLCIKLHRQYIGVIFIIYTLTI